jgi:hypothetical protein
MSTISTRTLAAYCLILSQPLLLLIGQTSIFYCHIFGTGYDCVNETNKSLVGLDIGAGYPIRVTLLNTSQNLCMLFFIFGLWFIHSKIKEDEKGYARISTHH